MARKGTQPALYELIRTRAAPPRAGGDSVPAPAPIASGAPARIVRVPVGSIYAAVAVVLVLIVASYLYGVSVGDRVARDRLAQQRMDEMNAAAELPPVDPMRAGRRPPSLGGGDGGGAPGGATPGGGQRPAASGSGSDVGSGAEAPGGSDAEDLGPAPGGDPRQDGLNYFVLAHTDGLRGQAMVDFCRRNGLDAHLIRDDNDKRRIVIVVPGFASGERQSDAVKALEAKIRSVGLKWGNTPGNRDFGDAYPMKFRAPGRPAQSGQ